MSTIQAKNTALQWERFRDHETYDRLRDGRPKDKWAVTSMVKAGHLDGDHLTAAEWYEHLLEGSRVRRGGLGEAIQGGRLGVSFETALDNGRQAYGARQAVHQRIEYPSRPDQRRLTPLQIREHMTTFDRLFDGHQTLLAVSLSKSGQYYRIAHKRIVRTLDALRDYHAETANELLRWNMSAAGLTR